MKGHSFATTQWSRVQRASDEDPAVARQALAELCASYRTPLYAFLRRSGYDPARAEDFTQQFLAVRLFEERALMNVSSGEGRFRSWLLKCLKNMVANELRHENSQRGGGRHPHVPLGREDEAAYSRLMPSAASADELYDRACAVALVERASQRVRTAYEKRDEAARFEVLKAFLPGASESTSYAAAAQELGLREDAVRKAVSNLRSRFWSAIRAEARETLLPWESLEDELQQLVALFLDSRK
jgi:RNA polymerase sigma-70 factor (ECF subfamily)